VPAVPTVATRPRTATRAIGLALLIPLVAWAITLLALPVFTYPLTTDQSIFALIGTSVAGGGLPYFDGWDIKPPAIYYTYAAFIGLFGRTGDTAFALRMLDFALVVMLCPALGWLGMRLGGRRVGLWAALLFAVIYLRESFWTLAQNDGVQMLPIALATMAAFKAGDHGVGSRRAVGYAALSGLACAAVFWYKYPFALFGVGLALAHLVRRGRSPWRATLREALGYLAGVALGIGGVVGLMLLGGVFGEWLIHLETTLAYPKGGGFFDTLGTVTYRMLRQIKPWWPLLLPLAIFGVVVLGAVWQNWRGRGKTATQPAQHQLAARDWALVILPTLASLAAIFSQGKGYEYHWLPILPAVILMSASGLERGLLTLEAWLARRERPVRYRALATATAAGWLLLLGASTWPAAWGYLTGGATQATHFAQFGYSGERYNAGESLQVAEYLAARTGPDDSLFIWGMRPEVYLYSDLRPATRFLMHYPLAATWSRPEWRAEALADLQAAPPSFMLVLTDDSISTVTGYHGDSLTLLSRDPGEPLTAWLRATYQRETTIGNFQIWARAG
jgi:4-amino-4-deoxy-L-arabinose transferase-like glycosyltransferase